MSDQRAARPGFKFLLTTGERPYIDCPPEVVFEGRISSEGKRVMRFPAPFQRLEITEMERVGPQKWSEIQAACVALGATIR